IPRSFIFAGELEYRSRRRMGKVNAATDTMATHTTPASTPKARSGWNVVAVTLQASISVTSVITRMIAATGEWKRSLTFDRRSGSTRSNDHANTLRMGMNVLPTIAGRLQNRNEATMIVVSTLLFTASPAKKW